MRLHNIKDGFGGPFPINAHPAKPRGARRQPHPGITPPGKPLVPEIKTLADLNAVNRKFYQRGKRNG
jgi:hypothetical protein